MFKSSQITYIYRPQNHKFPQEDFTISTTYVSLCPQTLNQSTEVGLFKIYHFTSNKNKHIYTCEKEEKLCTAAL